MAVMIPGLAFTGRNGVSYTTTGGAQEVEPADIALAFLNNWTQSPLATWPGIGDVPQDGAYGPQDPPSPLKIFQTAIPFIVPSSGSIGNNGALTGLTALPTTYSQGCYMWFAAAAIAAGSAAGWYYVVMSSGTAGTIYNNQYKSALIGGQPYIPPSPTAFATTGPGAFTGVTTAQTGPSWTLPANIMGANGVLEVTAMFANNNTAGTKTFTVKLGSGTIYTQANTTNVAALGLPVVQNQGQTGAQVVNQTGTFGAGTTGQTYLTQDTTTNLTMSVTLQHGTATDNAILDGVSCVLTPG